MEIAYDYGYLLHMARRRGKGHQTDAQLDERAREILSHMQSEGESGSSPAVKRGFLLPKIWRNRDAIMQTQEAEAGRTPEY